MLQSPDINRLTTTEEQWGGLYVQDQMQIGDHVRITRATERLKLIQPPNKTYFEILKNKLKWGEA